MKSPFYTINYSIDNIFENVDVPNNQSSDDYKCFYY